MFDLILNKSNLLDTNLNVFEAWYDENLVTLKLVEKLINKDICGYSNQTGSNRLAFYYIRLKDKNSFLDKIIKIRNDLIALKKSNGEAKEFHSFFEELPDEFSPQHLVQDLIGVRLVYYFVNDIELGINYFNIYPVFDINNIKGYQVVKDDSPIADNYQKFINSRIKDIYCDYAPTHKKSGYESFHLIVKYTKYALVRPDTKDMIDEYLANDEKLTNANDRPDILNDILRKYSIEIQLRSVLQHTWAQIEHRMKYSIAKSTTDVEINDPLFDADFKCHKALLMSAEYHQRIMGDRFLMLRHTALESEGVMLGKRTKYFKKKSEIKNIIILDKKIHNGDSKVLYHEIIALTERLSKEYGQDFFKFTHDLQFDEWGRQRVILLFIGYLLLFGDDETQSMIVTDIFVKKKIFASKNPTLCSQVLYEHMRFMDTQIRNDRSTPDEDKTYFWDPLVNYRSAGAYLMVSDYRRGVSLLKEVICHNFIDKYKTNRSINDIILNSKHIQRRIGEYLFFVYISEGESSRSELIEAISSMKNALSSTDRPVEDKNNDAEDRKIISNLIAYTFFRFMLLPTPNFEYFSKEIKLLVTNEIQSKFYNIDSLDKIKSCQSYQALSLIYYARNDVIKSLEFIEMTKKLLEEKAETHNVLPVHRNIFIEIYNFILNRSNHGAVGRS